MLVLSRKLNESVMIGDDVEVIVLDVREGVVKLGIKAPREVTVHRQEIYAQIVAENKRALTPKGDLGAVADMFKKLQKKEPPAKA